ncbi:MAG: sodium:solute symporter family transporter, partial [Verrucomicrobiales bacterium]
MHPADWSVLLIYLLGTVFLGVFLGRLVKNSSDLFGAGGTSPWWASGLSGFMTMFSANTFVVWGSIAFSSGLVAVSINLMYGVAALLVGYFVAARWKGMGVETPAEYVKLRFGKGALHFYTWSMMIFRVVGTAAALYALGKILVA